MTLSYPPYIELGPYQRVRATEPIRLPGSKSISNRTLLLAALARGKTTLHNVLLAEDTVMMLCALEQLGVTIHVSTPNNTWITPSQLQELFDQGPEQTFAVFYPEQGTQSTDSVALTCQVTGCGGVFPNQQAKLFLGNAGTAMRPLLAVLALQQGQYQLDGVERMRERPIGDLVDGLRQLGAQIDYVQQEGYPPLQTSPADFHQLKTSIYVKGSTSSQFITALLMAIPTITRVLKEITLEIEGELISKPYVAMTVALMQQFGVEVVCDDFRRFKLRTGQSYRVPNSNTDVGYLTVEGDASSASYFLGLGALSTTAVTVWGVGQHSLQGDVLFAKHLEKMGVHVEMTDQTVSACRDGNSIGGVGQLKPIVIDCTSIPDAAMTFAVLALFADGVSRLSGIASWRVKETDRIAAMATELRKFGAVVQAGEDFIEISPPGTIAQWKSPSEGVDTYNDHRMAMCFSLASMGPHKVRINHPACVAKTFPAYFEVFEKILE